MLYFLNGCYRVVYLPILFFNFASTLCSIYIFHLLNKNLLDLTWLELRKKNKKTSYNCLVSMEFLPWQIRVAFPGEIQLQQSRATPPTVHAGCFSLSIIQRTLTWTTGSLTCRTDVNPNGWYTGVYGHRKIVCIESWLWEENPLPHPGNQTCVSGVQVRCSTRSATSRLDRQEGTEGRGVGSWVLT